MTGLDLALPLLADESKKSGPIGFAVILVLCVVCYFLFKSFSRHLRKVREEFPDGRTAPPAEGSKAQTDADVPPSPPSDEPRP